MPPGRKRRGALFHGKRHHAAFAVRRLFECVANGGRQQQLRRDVKLLLLCCCTALWWRRRSVRHALITTAEAAFYRLAGNTVAPFIADDAVLRRATPRCNGSVPSRGHGVRVRIMAVREPGPACAQPLKTVPAVELSPALQVVAA